MKMFFLLQLIFFLFSSCAHFKEFAPGDQQKNCCPPCHYRLKFDDQNGNLNERFYSIPGVPPDFFPRMVVMDLFQVNPFVFGQVNVMTVDYLASAEEVLRSHWKLLIPSGELNLRAHDVLLAKQLHLFMLAGGLVYIMPQRYGHDVADLFDLIMKGLSSKDLVNFPELPEDKTRVVGYGEELLGWSSFYGDEVLMAKASGDDTGEWFTAGYLADLPDRARVLLRRSIDNRPVLAFVPYKSWGGGVFLSSMNPPVPDSELCFNRSGLEILKAILELPPDAYKNVKPAVESREAASSPVSDLSISTEFNAASYRLGDTLTYRVKVETPATEPVFSGKLVVAAMGQVKQYPIERVFGSFSLDLNWEITEVDETLIRYYLFDASGRLYREGLDGFVVSPEVVMVEPVSFRLSPTDLLKVKISGREKGEFWSKVNEFIHVNEQNKPYSKPTLIFSSEKPFELSQETRWDIHNNRFDWHMKLESDKVHNGYFDFKLDPSGLAIKEVKLKKQIFSGSAVTLEGLIRISGGEINRPMTLVMWVLQPSWKWNFFTSKIIDVKAGEEIELPFKKSFSTKEKGIHLLIISLDNFVSGDVKFAVH